MHYILQWTRHAGCIAAFLAASAHAQDVPTLDRVEVTGRGDKPGLQLDQPSAAGSRTGLSARELPASVETLTATTVRERGDYAVRDAVSRTTGLTDIASPGDGGMSFSARGFTGTNSVGLAEDGARLAVAAGTQTYPTDYWGYERIEVLRGPASVVFGSGTVGATINAVRKAPRRTFGFDAVAAVGDHETGRLGVGATGPLGEITSYRVDAYATTTDGVRDRGRARSHKLLSTLRVEPRADLRFELLADYSVVHPERYWGTPLVAGQIDESLRKENYNVSDGIIRYEDQRLRGRVAWQLTNSVELRDEIYVLNADRQWRNVELYSLDPATRLVERTSFLEILHDQRQRGNRLEAIVKAGGHQLVAGVDVAVIDFRHINNLPAGGTSTVPDRGFDPGLFASPDPTLPKFQTDTLLRAAYIEDAYRIDERFTVLAGLRYDHARIERASLVPGPAGFEKSLSGTAARLGVTWRVQPATSLYAQASTGHDPVTSLVTLNLGNRDFDLTKGRQVEVGIKQSLPDALGDWTAALYRIEKSDIVTSDPANPALSIQGGKQHSQGIELTAGITPAQEWRIEANLALLQARFDELLESDGSSRAGNVPPDVPRRVANVWLHRTFGDWQASLGARHVGKRFGDNANTIVLPAYSVFDASLAWFYSRALTFRAVGRNLGDKTYALVTYGPTQVLLGEPRRFEVVAELGF